MISDNHHVKAQKVNSRHGLEVVSDNESGQRSVADCEDQNMVVSDGDHTGDGGAGDQPERAQRLYGEAEVSAIIVLPKNVIV